MAQRSVPAPFLTKTYQMVEDPSTDDVISWNEDGTTFVVWKTADFAKDLLPKSFKHNNFSSFVRQLNTYGFRKTAPDKWEFANDYFKKGNKELLSEIRRRKTVSPTTAKLGGAAAGHTLSNSGEDMASTSTSSPDSKNPGSVETAPSQLVEENKRLRKDNESLSSELARAKKQCDELVAFLTHCKVGPDQIDRILRRPIKVRSTCNYDDDEENEGSTVNKEEEEEEEEAGGGCVKLFGVVLRKRTRDGEDVLRGPHSKEIKICI